MAYVSKFVDLDGSGYDLKAVKTAAIPFGHVDGTSTSTKFTATVDGITELYDGVCCYLRNGVVTSAANWTLNINGLGAKPVYSSLANETRTTTIFNTAYTMLFIYNSTRVEGGCWDIFYGYDSNTNTIGYQLRTNSSTRPVSDQCGRYRVLFSSSDDTKWVPANTSSSTDATSLETVNQRPINPFGDICYYGYTTILAANANVGTSYQWSQYPFTLGYSFNRKGSALTLTYPAPIYIKCAPQSNGSAIIDADEPYVQALPSTADGKIYIYLGKAYNATSVELAINHPVYEYKDGAIRQYTNAAASSITVDSALDNMSENPVQNKVIYEALDTASKEAAVIIDAGYITDYGLHGSQLTMGENVLYSGSSAANPCDLYEKINTEYLLGHINIVVRLKRDADVNDTLPSTFDHIDSMLVTGSDEYLMRFNTFDRNYYYFSVLLGGIGALGYDGGNLYAYLAVSSSSIKLTYSCIPLGMLVQRFRMDGNNVYKLVGDDLANFVRAMFAYGITKVMLTDITSSPYTPKCYRITYVDMNSGIIKAENIIDGVLRLFTMQVTNLDLSQNQYTINIVEKTLADSSDIPTATSDLTNDSGFITDAGVTSVNGSTGAVTGIQTTSNLVTSVTSSSTDSEYPSAKLFYDTLGDVETLLAAI